MGKTIKKTYDEVYGYFKSKGLELLDEFYKNNTFKMSCVDTEGYKLVVSYSKLKQGRVPSRFGHNNPYTIENIRHYIKLNRENVELVSTEYINAHEKLIFKCLIHDEEFNMNWANFKVGHGCSICSYELKLTIPIIKQKIIDMERDKEVELVSTEYIGANDILIFKCLIHNEEFNMKWANFRCGSGCPICAIEKISGENNWNWKGGITPLYRHLRNKIQSWKIDSFKKYNYRCDITSSNKNCLIHHLYPFSIILQETISTINLPIYKEINKYTEIELKSIEDKCLELHYKYGLGVCLCKEVHEEFHKIYGKKNNTREQYEEFRINKINTLK